MLGTLELEKQAGTILGGTQCQGHWRKQLDPEGMILSARPLFKNLTLQITAQSIVHILPLVDTLEATYK